VFQSNSKIELPEQPWFSSLGVKMSMASEERVKSTKLVPSHQQLWLRVSKEAANISTCIKFNW
jgi:hypothetical protein